MPSLWHDRRPQQLQSFCLAGRTAADAAQRGIRRNTHSTKEWLVDRHDNTAGYLGGLSLPIDQDDPHPEGGEFVGQRSNIGPLPVNPPVKRELDVKDAEFEHVAWHRAPDLDRSSEHVSRGSAILHLSKYVALVLRDCAWRHYAGLVNDLRGK